MSTTRLLVYLLAGAAFAVAGVLLMFFGRVQDHVTTQLLGVIVYTAAVPLLFQAKLSKMEGRIRTLERACFEPAVPRDCAAARPAPGEDA
jgi:sulfite exporter TauE/SafE